MMVTSHHIIYFKDLSCCENVFLNVGMNCHLLVSKLYGLAVEEMYHHSLKDEYNDFY